MTDLFPDLTYGVLGAAREVAYKTTGREIAMAVSAIYNVPVRRIMGVSQERQDVNARHAAWWVAYETGRLTTVQLGKIFRRHHTTVVYGKRQAVARREREGEFRRITDKLVERFG